MEHVDAGKKEITPSVHFWFRHGQETFDNQRTRADDLPNAAQRVLAHTKVPFVIRGYELRGFVEGTTPAERYNELAAWFALDPLVAIQKNLWAIRSRVKRSLESTSQVDERSRDISRVTDTKVSNWDISGLCSWINEELLHPLDTCLKITEITNQDSGFIELSKRREAELETIGVAQLKRLSSLITRLTSQQDRGPSGLISDFETAASSYGEAVMEEQAARSTAENAVFLEVWKSAKTLFDKNDNLTVCPICDTALGSSPHRTGDNVHLSLNKKLSELDDYRQVETKLACAKAKLTKLLDDMRSNLERVTTSLDDAGYDSYDIVAYFERLQSWHIDETPPSSLMTTSALTSTNSLVMDDIAIIENQQGEHTYAKAFGKVRELLTIKADLDRIEQTKLQLGMLHKELNRQSREINLAIVTHINGLIGTLGGDIHAIYKEIQGGSGYSPPIRIELPEAEHIDQQRAQLVIDFSANRKGVVPSGYLSDSQIHTLALALRLAAMRLLNKAVPILVLDDVVSSYDADHRKRIAGVLAKYFTAFQVIIVTHDEQFYNLIRDQLPESRWLFKRITDIRPGFGPVFDDHKTSDEVIQEKLDAGKPAANEIRQAEEEWFIDICRQFKTKVEMRSSDQAYRYDRGELAISLASFLKEVKLTPPKTEGVDGSFLSSLQTGVVENLGSHYSDNPHKVGSVGDDKARWEEFVSFRDLFECPSCGKRRFHKPLGVKIPLCMSCQTPFAFGSSEPASLDVT